MIDPQITLSELLDVFGAADASAAYLLCDRHPQGDVAFSVVESDLSSRVLAFGEVRELSERVAGGLARLGVGAGDRVATLMGKSADLVVAMLAIWRLGAVQVPLFTAFAPPAINARIDDNDTKIVIADAGQVSKLEASLDAAAHPRWQIVACGAAVEGTVSFDALCGSDPLPGAAVAVGGNGTFIELFTSGTTGKPKGVPIPLRAAAAMQAYQQFGLDHDKSDVFWNAADPGWAYGLYYAIIGPLALGHSSLLLHSSFSPELTWAVLQTFRVTNFAAGPTVYRTLRNAASATRDHLSLRHCSSAGEPLGPVVAEWAEQALGVAVFDHYGQTELGMVAGNPWREDLITTSPPGSMGRALPGWHLDVLDTDTDVPAEPGRPGRLAVDIAASPLMWFTGYRAAAERTAQRFTSNGRWYLTGDLAAQDDDGLLYFQSRDDDVILMAGYRIGPVEVENTLQLHQSVAEAAVIGVPDELRGEKLVAYVVTRTGATADDTLADELKQLVKAQYAAHAYPRDIHFVDSLPKTPSGKLQRFLLRRDRMEPTP